MMGLPYGEEIMIVGRTMWTQSTSTSVTDRQTDGQTDGRTDVRTDRMTITNTVQRIASHGKNPPPPEIFLTFSPKRLGIFSPNFAHLLHVPIYAGLQIFIQSSQL